VRLPLADLADALSRGAPKCRQAPKTRPDLHRARDCGESHLVGLTFGAELKSGLGFAFREGVVGAATVRGGYVWGLRVPDHESHMCCFTLAVCTAVSGGVICAETLKKVVLERRKAGVGTVLLDLRLI
jgi:hypothetical protein